MGAVFSLVVLDMVVMVTDVVMVFHVIVGVAVGVFVPMFVVHVMDAFFCTQRGWAGAWGKKRFET